MPNPKKSATPAAIRIIPPDDRKTDAEGIVRGLVSSPILAAFTIGAHLPDSFKNDIGDDCICIGSLLAELTKQVDHVNRKDKLDNMEALLVAQAHTLNALFCRLAGRAQDQQRADHFSTFLNLAMRAQNQCRATIETLATIKNPPNVAFVKQANVAQVQQVNNGSQAGAPTAPAKVIDSTPQLEQLDDNRLDAGTPATTSRPDSAVATVGEIHRPPKRRRQG